MTVVEVTKLFTQVVSLYGPVEVQLEGRTVVFRLFSIMMVGWCGSSITVLLLAQVSLACSREHAYLRTVGLVACLAIALSLVVVLAASGAHQRKGATVSSQLKARRCDIGHYRSVEDCRTGD